MSLRSCLRRIGRTRIPCSDWAFSASSQMTGSTLSRSDDLEVPHQQIHRLGHAGLLHALLVVGRVPGLLDHGAQVEALDQHAALFVHREVGGTDHALYAAPAQPGLGGPEQRPQDLLVVLELQEAEPAPVLLLVVVEGVVHLGGDAAHDAPVAAGQEVLGLSVTEEGVQAPVEKDPALELGQRHPQRMVSMHPERDVDERFQLPPA